jgi:hypothetical protein
VLKSEEEEKQKAGPKLSAQAKLSMRLFQVAAYVLQGEQGRAFADLGVFRDEYRRIPKDYSRSWIYTGTKAYIKARPGLKPAEVALLLGMMDLLEAKPEEAAVKLAQFEASFDRIFDELKASSAPADKIGKNNR